MATLNVAPGMERPGQRFWKIAPGRNASIWKQCRDGGYIAVGWNEMGNLAGLDWAGFQARARDLMAEHPDWAQQGLGQLWLFLEIREGDRVVANRGTTTILGIGTVAGRYYFEPGGAYGQRLPVRWEDTEPRAVRKPGWRRTLMELSRREFEGLISINPQPEPPG